MLPLPEIETLWSVQFNLRRAMAGRDRQTLSAGAVAVG